MPEYKSKFMRRWMAIVRPIGVFQTYLIMTVVYVLIVPFFSLKRIVDPLRLRLRGDTYWEPRKKQEDLTLERYYKPF